MLPPPPQPPKPPAVTPDLGLIWMDRALVVLLLGLAFVLGAFSIRNSDFFQNLAVGRSLVQGKYHFGADPFSWASEPNSWVNSLTGEKVVWVNHGWLFGLLAYGLWLLAPAGQLLVLFRALLVVGVAGLLVLIGRRPGQRLWVPASCAVLAVVVLSPRLLLQPVLTSYLFLALTLWLLERPRLLHEAQASGGEQPTDRFGSWWLLPPLFALWVNLDNWFLLGPLTVALYLVGTLVQRSTSPTLAGVPARLGLVLAVGVLATLLNPYHLHAWTLPYQLGLSGAARALNNDAQFRGAFSSPLFFGGIYYSSSVGLSVAGMSYFLLLLLSLVSLIVAAQVPRDEWHWSRTLVLAAFTLLSVLNFRTIPFFAVVAGPITALNFLSWWKSQQPAAHLSGWLVTGRRLSLLGVVLLLTASIPGWLQAQPYSARRMGWRLDPDNTLKPMKQLAEQIATWREQNQLPTDRDGKVRWYNTNLELASSFGWCCPGEQTFMDLRLTPFTWAAEAHALIRRSLGATKLKVEKGKEKEAAEEARELEQKRRTIFRDKGISLVLCYESDLSSAPILVRMLKDPDEWVLLYRDGKTAVFGWNDPDQRPRPAPGPFSDLRFDPKRLAFGNDARRAPEERPARAPRTYAWYTELWESAPPKALDGSLAQMDAMYFETQGMSMASPWIVSHQQAQQTNVLLALVGALSQSRDPQVGGVALWARASALSVMRRFFWKPLDAGPPEALYLAIREARWALVENPDDAQVYLLLSNLYSALGRQTRERDYTLGWLARDHWRPQGLPLPTRIRLVQTLAALHQALKLNPDLALAHQLLADQYQELQYLDLAFKHRREVLRCIKEMAERNGKTPEMARNLEEAEKNLKKLETQVDQVTNRFEVQATNRSAGERAALALSQVQPKPWLAPPRLRHGLAEKAVETLEQIPGKELTPPQAIALIDLQFELGQLDKIRDLLESEGAKLSKVLGTHPDLDLPAFEVYQLLLAAASGDYQKADQAAQDLIDSFSAPRPRPAVPPKADQVLRKPDMLPSIKEEAKNAVVISLGHYLLLQGQSASGLPIPLQFINPAAALYQAKVGTYQLLSREAELRVLRGWLALEAGHVDRARQELRQAMTLTSPPGALPADFPGRSWTQMGLEWLKEKR